ncbi:hypothetical protein BV22DRAFT_1193208 [Leucogyrophana mollusca]|uniref:Uncharacterized protein n=1 Tax=Leucogyrophana mollusca TaxID=85980 RepID=A0ACB8BQH5_9AGAM|nr:hypothetical protein BV22DRAFT_1193208 [Leucogyrophana mollusca]
MYENHNLPIQASPTSTSVIPHRPPKRPRLESDELHSASNQPSTQQEGATVKRERSPSPAPTTAPRQLVTSGVKRYAPYPQNCLKSCPDYRKNRAAWAAAHYRELKCLNIQKERVLFRDDGLIIDWRSSIPVWSDTLKPDASDLASTISHAHLANHNMAQRQQSFKETPRMSPSTSNRSITPADDPAKRPKIKVPVPPRPSSTRRSLVSNLTAQPTNASNTRPLSPCPPPLRLPLRPNSTESFPTPNGIPGEDTGYTADSSISTTDSQASNIITANPSTSPVADMAQSLNSPSTPAVSIRTPSLPEDTTSSQIDSQIEPSIEQEIAVMTKNFLIQYVQTFDADRASLASGYSRNATFSYRVHELPSGQSPRGCDPSVPLSENVKLGRLDITTTLMSLTPHKFTPSSAPACVNYDMMYLGEGLGMFAVCRGPLVDATDEQRLYAVHSFILRRKDDDEEDRSADGVWPLVAVSHQITIFEGKTWR